MFLPTAPMSSTPWHRINRVIYLESFMVVLLQVSLAKETMGSVCSSRCTSVARRFVRRDLRMNRLLTKHCGKRYSYPTHRSGRALYLSLSDHPNLLTILTSPTRYRCSPFSGYHTFLDTPCVDSRWSNETAQRTQ